MARSGMADLLAQMRRLADDSGTVAWSDDQLEDTLDRYRVDVWAEALAPMPVYSGGSVIYRDYMLAARDVEGTASTDGWRLYDSNGDAASGYTLYGDRGLVRFTADQGGTTYWADYRTYDPYLAAADLWGEKAGSVASKYDFGTGMDKFSRSQWFRHCREMAAEMRSKAKPMVVQIRREDVTP